MYLKRIVRTLYFLKWLSLQFSVIIQYSFIMSVFCYFLSHKTQIKNNEIKLEIKNEKLYKDILDAAGEV